VEETSKTLAPDEKAEEMFRAWVAPQSIEFKSQRAEKAFRERATRIKDAIQLRIPDRVPFWFQLSSFFPCRYAGITCKEAMYHAESWFAANRKTFLDFEPDMFFNPGAYLHTAAQSFEALGTKNMKWPGHGLDPDCSFQYVEGEYMKAEEYDLFIHDLTDYTVRTFLPRVFEALEPFSMLPPLKSLGITLPAVSALFTLSPIQSAFKAIHEAGLESMKWSLASEAFVKEMNGYGFPLLIGGYALVPFDAISDLFRGMRGTMLDMYRRPDKLLEAIERLFPPLFEMSVFMAKKSGNPGVFIPLHRGADGFMSKQQFETFYWPGLKKFLLALIEEGLTPIPFFEGNYTSRLEYLAELPRGKVLGLFDSTDIYELKKVLGETMCISGLMPLTLLQFGSVKEVKDYAKGLIDGVGKGGGFMMGPRSAMDEANPDIVKVWAEFTREYGAYR
jgi:hypothetical protein